MIQVYLVGIDNGLHQWWERWGSFIDQYRSPEWGVIVPHLLPHLLTFTRSALTDLYYYVLRSTMSFDIMYTIIDEQPTAADVDPMRRATERKPLLSDTSLTK